MKKRVLAVPLILLIIGAGGYLFTYYRLNSTMVNAISTLEFNDLKVDRCGLPNSCYVDVHALTVGSIQNPGNMEIALFVDAEIMLERTLIGIIGSNNMLVQPNTVSKLEMESRIQSDYETRAALTYMLLTGDYYQELKISGSITGKSTFLNIPISVTKPLDYLRGVYSGGLNLPSFEERMLTGGGLGPDCAPVG